ncbi:hypothetical protein EE612_041090 [Oryza sativa]|nr:hypothetical protein EE612_041090 [Oryza sativa]
MCCHLRSEYAVLFMDVG